MRAQRELGAELPQLHARAARWYAARGMGSEALRHAVAAEEWDLATELVVEHWFGLFVRGQGDAIRGLVDALPEERLQADAELAAALACAAFEVGDAEAAEARLEHARLAAEPPARRAAAALPGDDGACATARREPAGRFRQRARSGRPAARGGRRATATGPTTPARRWCTPTSGRTALWAHRLDRAREELERGASQAQAVGLDYVGVSALSALSLVDVMQRGPAGVAAHAPAAIELAEQRGWPTIKHTACAHTALAIAAFYDLRPDAAEEHLARAAEASSRGYARHVQFMLAHLQARIGRASEGRPAEGLRMLETFEVTHRVGTPPPYERAALASMRARLHGGSRRHRGRVVDAGAGPRAEGWLDVEVTAARLRLAEGDPDGAVEILAALGSSMGVHSVADVEHAVLEAVARDAAGEPGRAAEALEARPRAG